ncbi:Uncharacterised protein [Mycobacteroides abscessus subsp. massiliense]|nr:Uncharacterised protein [Mycobacteroides abscessus subsp. massiliense]
MSKYKLHYSDIEYGAKFQDSRGYVYIKTQMGPACVHEPGDVRTDCDAPWEHGPFRRC